MKTVAKIAVVLALAASAAGQAAAQRNADGQRGLVGGNTGFTKADVDPKILYDRGVAYLQEKNYLKADQTFRELLKKDQRDAAANFMMGIAQIGLEDMKEARRFLLAAVGSKPDFADARGRLGWVEIKLGNPKGADTQRQALVKLQEKCNGSCPTAAQIDTAIKLIDGAATPPA